MVNLIKNIRNLKSLIHIDKNPRTWKSIEYFDRRWTNRIKEMAQYIKPNQSVVDLGCGKMWLKEYLLNNEYFPVDYKDRGPGTIVCNFNLKEFPRIKADVAFISGALEYVDDPTWFVSQVSNYCNECVLSYCTSEDYPDAKFRQKQAWVNNLSRQELIDLFNKSGFKLTTENVNIPKNRIFYFTK